MMMFIWCIVFLFFSSEIDLFCITQITLHLLVNNSNSLRAQVIADAVVYPFFI